MNILLENDFSLEENSSGDKLVYSKVVTMNPFFKIFVFVDASKYKFYINGLYFLTKSENPSDIVNGQAITLQTPSLNIDKINIDFLKNLDKLLRVYLLKISDNLNNLKYTIKRFDLSEWEKSGEYKSKTYGIFRITPHLYDLILDNEHYLNLKVFNKKNLVTTFNCVPFYELEYIDVHNEIQCSILNVDHVNISYYIEHFKKQSLAPVLSLFLEDFKAI